MSAAADARRTARDAARSAYQFASTRRFHAQARVLDLVRQHSELLDALLLPGELRDAIHSLRAADADVETTRNVTW